MPVPESAHDLPSSAKVVLNELQEADAPLSRKAIQDRTGEGKYAVLGAVKRLRKRDLITRTRDAGDLRTALYEPISEA